MLPIGKNVDTQNWKPTVQWKTNVHRQRISHQIGNAGTVRIAESVRGSIRIKTVGDFPRVGAAIVICVGIGGFVHEEWCWL